VRRDRADADRGTVRLFRRRYRLVMVVQAPPVRTHHLDRLSVHEYLVSRHWFRFAALQARLSAIENQRERVEPLMQRGKIAPAQVHFYIAVIS